MHKGVKEMCCQETRIVSIIDFMVQTAVEIPRSARNDMGKTRNDMGKIRDDMGKTWDDMGKTRDDM